MVNSITRRLAVAVVGAVGLAGCMLPPPQPVSTSMSAPSTTVGSLEPVYNPPSNTPFRCIWAGTDIVIDRVPGDPTTQLTETSSPVATMGNRRGDWLLIVSRAGNIGWIYDPHEMSVSQAHPRWWCHVHQNAQGAIVFDYYGTNASF